MRAYIACALGDFARAEALCRSLARAGDAAVRARAAITLGAVRRQTGRHALGRRADKAALRAAPDAATRAHALIGLAADAVGLWDAAGCADALARAASEAPRGDWRLRVRLEWVRAELALLTGRPRRAAAHARHALDRSRRAAARRHESKSLLFLAAALRTAGDPAWPAAARRAFAVARGIGARPVAEAAAALLREREPGARARR